MHIHDQLRYAGPSKLSVCWGIDVNTQNLINLMTCLLFAWSQMLLTNDDARTILLFQKLITIWYLEYLKQMNIK